MQRNPLWPYELAEALGSIAISFANYEFVFAHLVGFAENLDKEILYKEVLTLSPSEKLKRLRLKSAGKTDEVSKLYSALCDRFEVILEERNRYIHAYWYRSQERSGEFVFVDIHGRKDKLSKETHTCTVRDVMVVSTACHVQLNNLQALRSCTETAPFFAYYLPPDALPISSGVLRKVPHDHRKQS
ncbi:hypothetical protein DWU98_17500 [Dyella monticola]|uniref:Uncharacterized protein n=1 Tax=Dyella monticola TaxID=1927958 RepID=A0A370WUF8_9GAMM|nr:hypothetical protein [Dyella monticola]RDS79585.1 hypothetical protein DWU98_17500 [Dyella monticola]